MGEFEISYVSSTSQYTETYLHENFSEKSIDLGQRETEENAHPTKNEFYNQFVNIIRVSTQNRMSNFKQENIIDEAVRSVNSSYIEEDIDDGIQRKLNTLEQKFRRRSSLNNRPRLQGSQMSKVKISPGSCFA